MVVCSFVIALKRFNAMPYTQIPKVKAKYLHEKRGRFHPRSEVLGGNLQQEMKDVHDIVDVH